MTEQEKFEAQGRGRKSYKIARVLRAQGEGTPRAVDRLGSDLRHAVEYDAGVPHASPICWATVKGILQAMAEEDAWADAEAERRAGLRDQDTENLVPVGHAATRLTGNEVVR